MDYEKKYKEALEWMQSLYDGLHGATKEDAEHYFPELKENEDEKIRKGLIKAVSRVLEGHKLFDTDVTREEALDWLEKQGDNKEFDDEWEVNPGLYKCIKRMFDNTPENKLLFETGNLYKCISKNAIAEFESSYGHSVFLIDPVVRKHFIKIEDEDKRMEFETKFKPGDWISNGRYVKKIIDINSDWPYYIFQDGSSYRIKEIDTKWHIMPNVDELKWVDMETKECHCYNCVLFDRKNNMCKCATLCKEYHNTYKGFYTK